MWIFSILSNGKPGELSDDLQKKYEKCLDILKVSQVHRKLIEPFTVFGYDLFHAGKSNTTQCIIQVYLYNYVIRVYELIKIPTIITGSTSSKFGALVGIPINFTYQSLDDIEKQNVQVDLSILFILILEQFKGMLYIICFHIFVLF